MDSDERTALLDRIRRQMDEAVARLQRQYIEHVMSCDDPVGCEIRAWQEYYRHVDMQH